MSSLTLDSQATVLLTAQLPSAGNDSAKPLTPVEWGRFAIWLNARGHRPAQLLDEDPYSIVGDWPDQKVPLERINTLLNRSTALALAMEKWQRAGLWIVTRSDPSYPKKLKKRLGQNSPAVLFGCGSQFLLNHGGLAVIGSRKANGADNQYSRALGMRAAEHGVSIISGGARGIDESAMLGALEAEGSVVGVLADNLLKKSTSQKYRKHLMENNLTLLSIVHPEARFNTGNAMGRNKYIYCLADTAFVVHSEKSGGTWSGATENLKHGWVPLFVKECQNKDAGNTGLIAKGGKSVPATVEELDFPGIIQAKGMARDKENDDPTTLDQDGEKAQSQKVPIYTGQRSSMACSLNAGERAADSAKIEFYGLFCMKLQELDKHGEYTPDQLIEKFDLKKLQLNFWLKKSIQDEILVRYTKPVRYKLLPLNKSIPSDD